MKIAVVIKDCAFAKGGAERYASRLLWRLSESKIHDVHLFSHSWDPNLEERVQCHFVSYQRKPGFLKQSSFAKNVKQQLGKYNFDLILGLTQFMPMDIFRTGGGLYLSYLEKRYPNLKARFLKRWTPKSASTIRLENKILRSPKTYFFMANSHMCRNELIEYYGIDSEKIDVIYNGVNKKVFNTINVRKNRHAIRAEYDLDENEIVFLFVGNGFGRKNLDTVIRMAKELGANLEKFRFVVLGKGRIGQYRRKAKDLGVEKQFLFLGPQEEIYKWYQASDALIHPAIYDPCSNACFEALSCGLPVLTTKTNGASHWIKEGKNGFVIENPRDAVAFAQKAEVFLELIKRERMRHDAPETVASLTDENHDRALVELLEKTFQHKQKVEHLKIESPFYVKN